MACPVQYKENAPKMKTRGTTVHSFSVWTFTGTI